MGTILEEIKQNLYRLEIPLPQNPLRALNSYIIKGKERNLIIDTGLNRKECLEAMLSGLNELEVDLSVTDLFITHMHADHSGLISHLASPTSRVFCSGIDAYKINHSNDWYEMLVYACRNGFPPDYEAITQHPFFKFCAHQWVDFTLVKHGDTIDAGDYHFVCLATPGHTDGHLCLYDADKRLLVAGDNILAKITPNIQLFADEGDPLHDFLSGLNRISEMDIELVLPAHRSLITDHRARINELKEHHSNRARSIMSILRQGPQNAYEIASQMDWNLTYKDWDKFPVQQKWFATGEVIAHLRFLEVEGRVKSEWRRNQICYTLK